VFFGRIFLAKHKLESPRKHCRDPDLDPFLAAFQRVPAQRGQDAELGIAAGAVAAGQE